MFSRNSTLVSVDSSLSTIESESVQMFILQLIFLDLFPKILFHISLFLNCISLSVISISTLASFFWGVEMSYITLSHIRFYPIYFCFGVSFISHDVIVDIAKHSWVEIGSYFSPYNISRYLVCLTHDAILIVDFLVQWQRMPIFIYTLQDSI